MTLTSVQADLCLVLIAFIFVIIIAFFKYFSIHRANKQMDLYLCIKRNRYRGKDHNQIIAILISEFGFDSVGAYNLICKADNEEIAYFKELEL